MSDALPEWQDFRDRKAGESEGLYAVKLAEYNAEQHRRRDHWLANQNTAILGRQEMLQSAVMALPDKVIAAVEAKRRTDRRKFLRDLFVFAIGLASIIGSLAAIIGVLK